MSKWTKTAWSWIGRVPGYATTTFGALTIGLAVGLGSVTHGTLQRWLFIGAAAAIVIVTVIAVAQEQRSRSLRDDLQALQTEHDLCSAAIDTAVQQALDRASAEANETMKVLFDDLQTLLHQIGEALLDPRAAERSKLAFGARKSLVTATTSVVGDAIRGTRANMFRLQDGEDGPEMVPDGFWGRGVASTRVFRPGDATFDATMAGETRFRQQTNKVDADTGAPLSYETYLTCPIRLGTETLYGVLTVDCEHRGELSDQFDTPRMMVMAAMIAMTYRAEDLRLRNSGTK